MSDLLQRLDYTTSPPPRMVLVVEEMVVEMVVILLIVTFWVLSASQKLMGGSQLGFRQWRNRFYISSFLKINIFLFRDLIAKLAGGELDEILVLEGSGAEGFRAVRMKECPSCGCMNGPVSLEWCSWLVSYQSPPITAFQAVTRRRWK